MIAPSNRARIVVATRPVDFRMGHDGLAAVVKIAPRRDPGLRLPGRPAEADLLGRYWPGDVGLVADEPKMAVSEVDEEEAG